MNLSTSSSRTAYFKIFLAMMVVLSLSMASIRLFTYIMDASPRNWLGRVMEAKAALPRITREPDDLAMFFGSSMVRAGFSPRQFDAEMAERGVMVKSFNFGFGGLNPLFQDFLARRVREAFEKEDRRLKLALIEFNPFQTTITRRDRARASEDSYITLLANNRELFEILLDDPERGVRLFNIRYLRDSISAEMITNYFANPFQPPAPRGPLEEDEAIAQKRRELGEELNKRFEQDYPDYVPSMWSYEWQGGGTIPEERSAETLQIVDEYYATLQTPYRMDNARLRRIHTADIIDLNFDEELVVSFIEVVKNFQEFADRVEVILLPKNTKWIQNPPEAIQRMNEVIARIEAETGVRIRNLQEMEEITPEMFGDATHLNRYTGAVAFTSYLVNLYAADL